MSSTGVAGISPIPIGLTPLFEARWSYEEFVQLMPFGPESEGQAFAYSRPSRVEGECLSGAYQMTQYPRWRADGLLLADAHGVINGDAGGQVMTRAAGYVIPVPDKTERWEIRHWMRLWTGEPELSWLNAAVACGIGSMSDGEARVSYFTVAPVTEKVDPSAEAPGFELLGTARWRYPEYETVRPFGDSEGVGFAISSGEVREGVLAGSWRGWHYPTYLRDGLYQLDAHGVINGPAGVILNRHAGLAIRPAQPSGNVIYEAVQHATFVTEAPELAALNRTLAIGVGFVRDPDLVTVSFYALPPAA